MFFKGIDMTLPMSDEKRTWDDFIIKSSRDRPRDAIQLVENMVDAAMQDGAQIIGSEQAAKAMVRYSAERLDDLENEFAIDCATIRQVINTFWDVPFEVDFEPLRQHLLRAPSYFTLNIRGRVLRPENEDDALALLSFLHETGFINPRVKDARMPRAFRHILFQEDPHFAKRANWNAMQSSHWEIHPAFRTYLIGSKEAELAKVIKPNPTLRPR